MDRLIYREALEVKPRNLDGSRNCQDAIENKERRPGRKRIYWGFVEKLSSLKKTYKDECSKLATQPSNILSSQNISQHICKAYIDPNTHTHTLNKSNQFYISKIS